VRCGNHRDAKKWRDALASYRENPSVRNNLEVERFMDRLDPEIIRKSNSEGWHGFLRVYFNWKFKGRAVAGRGDFAFYREGGKG
jgi:hypothetical protein